jgi:hypothetical protein
LTDINKIKFALQIFKLLITKNLVVTDSLVSEVGPVTKRMDTTLHTRSHFVCLV